MQMKKIGSLILAAVIVLVACQKEQKVAGNQNAPVTNATKNQSAATDYSGYAGTNMPGSTTSRFGSNYEVTKVVPLIAGQNTVVGDVTVSNDDDYVYITYNISNPLVKISQVHLYIGDSTEIPANNSGNPIPGQFPNKITFKKILVNSYTFAFPTAEIDDCFSVAAHAVIGGETAWGQGTLFPNANQWGMYFNACKASHPTEG
jgi:hypothetical protein